MRAKVILIFFVIYGFVVIQARVMTLSENQGKETPDHAAPLYNFIKSTGAAKIAHHGEKAVQRWFRSTGKSALALSTSALGVVGLTVTLLVTAVRMTLTYGFEELLKRGAGVRGDFAPRGSTGRGSSPTSDEFVSEVATRVYEALTKVASQTSS